MCIGAQNLIRSRAKNNNHIHEMITYFGVIQEIIILDYYCVEYPFFKCDWEDVYNKNEMKTNEISFTMVNLNGCLSNHYRV
jgi:hypothetical protein